MFSLGVSRMDRMRNKEQLIVGEDGGWIWWTKDDEAGAARQEKGKPERRFVHVGHAEGWCDRRG